MTGKNGGILIFLQLRRFSNAEIYSELYIVYLSFVHKVLEQHYFVFYPLRIRFVLMPMLAAALRAAARIARNLHLSRQIQLGKSYAAP